MSIENPLTFAEFRRNNLARARHWNGGEHAPLDFAMMELAGEVGEACNAAKKLARLRMGWKGGADTSANLREELADIVICVDLVAMQLGIDLGQAVAEKFNATSAKHGFAERLPTLDINGEMHSIAALCGQLECQDCGTMNLDLRKKCRNCSAILSNKK